MSARVGARWLLVGHLGTAVGLLGADLVLLALGVHGVLGADPVTVYPAMSRLAGWVMAPLALAALATGAWLTLRGRPGVSRQGWVRAKLGLTLGLTTLLLLVALPGLEEVAQQAAGPGGAVAERDRVVYAVVPATTVILLLLNVVLGVHRPRFTNRTPTR